MGKVPIGEVVLWLLAVLMATIIVCCVGCGPMITSGMIVGKKFVAAHTDTTVTLDGEGMPNVTVDYEPDRWYVTFEKVDEDGQLKRRTICVDKTRYEAYRVGEWLALERP